MVNFNDKLNEKYASRKEEFQKIVQGVRDKMKEDREAFKMEIDKLKKEEIENARNEVAKFKVLDENLDE
ncbi:hypothetical protein GCK72_010927 [Caenorhabditis remanei]|uniref:Uncharacterized protein n=1 Tax=Caenorhabditis remanei TaxID=31234 RepID=A0A6A5H6E6_CAERE|nr:hypothetical protein GCK72_010927 [Caenorhabditis remanei]KAF1762665.1 hypothetical protein GCK72_010927 [Caenorhabditis remanei]